MNILDYLAWRGDLSLQNSPFNEVDNLILSELAYVTMENIVPGDGSASVSLAALCRAYEAAGYDQSHLVNDPYPLLQKAAVSARFQEVRVSRYRNLVDQARQVQFAAVTFSLSDGTLYLAFRGTDNTIVGWREDFNFCCLAETPGQAEAVAYVNEAAAESDLPLRIGGHSKGGNFAVYAAAFCDESIRETRILQVFSNDGPGFNQTVAAAPQYASILGKVEKIIPESSLVGILLSSREKMKVIQSCARGVQQHNPYSWCVTGPAFDPADQRSFSSLFMDETLGRWIETLDDRQRADLVSGVFDSLEASGSMTLSELNANKWISYNAIAKAVRRLDPDTQSSVLGALKKLAATGRGVLWNEAKKTLGRHDSVLPQMDRE